MNISLRLLRYVTAAADSGNVTEAARKLQVSQPSVSAAIAELEQMLGIAIFVRHHAKGVTLTPAGQKLIAEARLLLKHAEEFSKSAESLGDIERGEVTIGCFPTLAACYMPAVMTEFSRRYPLIQLVLADGDQERLLADVANGRVELAFTFNHAVPATLDATIVMQLPFVVSLPPDHRLAKAPTVSLHDLKDDPMIFFGDQLIGGYITRVFDAAGVSPIIRQRTGTFEVMRGLVARGHGYSVHVATPSSSTTYDGGTVVVKPIRDTVPKAEIACIAPGVQLMRPAVRLFAEFLADALVQPAGEEQPMAEAAE
ncbi:LysR family transcriptional regulator [Rhodomicrobium sp. Az07]|uniref:LysR family transcriptional regulator n=1 Tax=Rhodomicrobium sp. Az07 TaxID=2839034 RepID=UPI001BE89DD9|nr:LysR family transcriptional regulator [Rhodomicrobium sp. Az07]MBT3072133.1 LysR family transcriptional regulator [Rhodomicrobium sp. Az07]